MIKHIPVRDISIGKPWDRLVSHHNTPFFERGEGRSKNVTMLQENNIKHRSIVQNVSVLTLLACTRFVRLKV